MRRIVPIHPTRKSTCSIPLASVTTTTSSWPSVMAPSNRPIRSNHTFILTTTSMNTTTLSRTTCAKRFHPTNVSLRAEKVFHSQRRSYLYLPTSWKEFELRWLRDKKEQRTVYVQLLNDNKDDTRYHDETQLSIQTESPDNKNETMMVTETGLTQSIRVRNRIMTGARNQADRMSRHYVRMAASAKRMIVPVTLTEYSEEKWFCPTTGRPLTSRDATGRFVNPWMSQSTDGVKSISEIVHWRWDRARRHVLRFLSSIFQWWNNIETTPNSIHAKDFSVRSSSTAATNHQVERSDLRQHLKCTWIGHNTCLFQQANVSILTDPIFSARSSPFQSLPIGVAREVPAAITIDELPSIDICLVSHDHYDHLDKDSVVNLKPKVNLWVVPTGIKEWLQTKANVEPDTIVELEWWESIKLQQSPAATNSSTKRTWHVMEHHSAAINPLSAHPALSDRDVQYTSNNEIPTTMWISLCPVQHWGSRTFFDRNYRLWGSFAVFLPGSKFFFAGDTALPQNFPLFDQIRDFVGGNIDMAAIPIGAYDPSFYNEEFHCSPEEAVQIHQILKSKQSMAMHWGTFALSEEPMDEPPIRLERAATKSGANFITVNHGESMEVKCRSQEDVIGHQNRQGRILEKYLAEQSCISKVDRAG